MSWFQDDLNPTRRWAHRQSLTVDATASGAASDISLVLPNDLDAFWNTVRSAGEDVRITGPDGRTLATFDLQGFNATTRVCTVEVQNYTPPAAKMFQLFLYWGQADCVTGLTSFVVASPKTAYLNLIAPSEPIVRAGPERPGETRPRQALAKRSDETITVWWDFSAILRDRAEPYSDHYHLEEISYAEVDVQTGGASQAAMFTATATRLHDRGWVMTELKAGTSGTAYTVICTVTTSLGRVLKAHQLLRVRNPSE